jgi:hypothetical protein
VWNLDWNIPDADFTNFSPVAPLDNIRLNQGVYKKDEEDT